jgi:orotidine-5'-phosphate decarboxylase
VKHFSDVLAESIIAKRSLVCVGLDPDLAQMPPQLVAAYSGGGEEGAAACAQEFCCRIVECVADSAAVVKPQAAFFEQFGPAGWASLRAVVGCAHQHGLPVILDAKRGDIASTGRAYARALFGGAELPGGGAGQGLAADAVTASPYLGEDSLTPFTDYCARGKGVFVLTRTSNPGAVTLQEQQVDGRPLYLAVADLVGRLGEDCVGALGYSDVGAVAGATAPAALSAVRAVLPRAFILVPGYGAQGGSADDLAGLRSGEAAGVVVNASRSVIYAWRDSDREYGAAAADAARSMRDELVGVLGA